MVTRNLRIVYAPATPVLTYQFENMARLRFRVLALACFANQDECADFLKLSLRTVNRYGTGQTSVPGWVLIALEQRARDLGVEPARAA